MTRDRSSRAFRFFSDRPLEKQRADRPPGMATTTPSGKGSRPAARSRSTRASSCRAWARFSTPLRRRVHRRRFPSDVRPRSNWT